MTLSDAGLLRKITGGGIYSQQPVISALVPTVYLDGLGRRSPAQAARLKVLGTAMRRMACRARRNPPIEGLADTELIRILTGASVTPSQASEILRTASHRTLAEAKTMYGVTAKQAEKIRALGEIYTRVAKARIPDRVLLTNPELVYDHFAPLIAHLEIEQFFALPMDTRSRLIGQPVAVSKGDVDGTDASPRIFFRSILRAGAVSGIAVHNHPTGNPEPSPADVNITRQLVLAGRQLGTPLNDHVIIATLGYTSLRAQRPDLFT